MSHPNQEEQVRELFKDKATIIHAGEMGPIQEPLKRAEGRAEG